MGICESTKNSKDKDGKEEEEFDEEKMKALSERFNKIVQPGKHQVGAIPRKQQGPIRPVTSRCSAVIVDNDVIISRSEVNPELAYTKERKIGEGTFGEVWLVKQNELQSRFAMKIIKKLANRPIDEKAIMNEINILKKLDHPNIVKILDFYSAPSKYLIITEYCPIGELFGEIIKVNHYGEAQAAFIMKQIFRAVSYCHDMHVIHRDLKPENILIDSKEKNGCPHVKIIDFGTAKVFEKGQNENRFIGSSYYIAPEVIQRNYTEKCDVWSCGVIMYILLTGKPPFSGENDQDVMKNVKKGVYDTKTARYTALSIDAQDLLTNLLQVNPAKRISASKALEHKWFASIRFQSTNAVNEISLETAKELLTNIKQYKNDNVVRSTVMAYLVHYNTNIEQCREAGKLFNAIDNNGNGRIEKEELRDGLLKYWKLPIETIDKEVEEIFSHIDSDQNGYIEYEEFIRAAVNQSQFLSNNYLRFAFKYFDKDKSGDLSLEEIYKTFRQNVKNQKDPEAMKELKKIFDDMDINKDGRISYDEFCQMMKSIITTQVYYSHKDKLNYK